MRPLCAGAGLAGLSEEELANFQLPPDMLKDLPANLQKDCAIM